MQTLPYCGAPPIPGAVSWNLDPILLGSLLIAAGTYAVVARRTGTSTLADRQPSWRDGSCSQPHSSHHCAT